MPADKQKCARCGRQFTPRKEGDRFGPKCAVKNRYNHIEIRNKAGEVLAAIV